jgi:DinB superfamily
MPPTTPYTADLDGRDPLAAIRDTCARIRAIAGEWTPSDFERSYAPGKWSARQILTHLAQSEIALSYRVRMALTTPGYAAQAFDQDRWMSCEPATSGQDALDAFLGLAAMNAALFDKLTTIDRAATLSHPEYGSLTVDWVIHQIAGHQIHHCAQLESIATRS